MTDLIKMNINFSQAGGPREFCMWFDREKKHHASMLDTLSKGTFYDPDVSTFMMRCLRPGDAFVDVGANQGFFTILGGTLVGPAGAVIAVEPGENNIPDLQRNIENNGFTHCRIVGQPLADTERTVDFYLNADDAGGNALWDVATYPGNVKSAALEQKTVMESTTLSRVLSQFESDVRLVKIDTEGAEEIILRGGIEGLERKSVPFVITELHNFGLAKLGCSQQSLRGLMEWAGYDCFVLGHKGGLPVYIPPRIRITMPGLLNLLFARRGAVSDLFPEAFIDPRLF